MSSLGSFAAAAREYKADDRARDTFEFCGETFTVHGTIPAMVELTISASWVGKIPVVEGDAALYEALRSALTIPGREVDGTEVPPDRSEWDRFYRLAIDRDPDPEWLTSIALHIMAAQIGRPTEQQPTSSAGLLPTSTSSNSSASDTPA